jgi:hypothetical protein
MHAAYLWASCSADGHGGASLMWAASTWARRLAWLHHLEFERAPAWALVTSVGEQRSGQAQECVWPVDVVSSGHQGAGEQAGASRA